VKKLKLSAINEGSALAWNININNINHTASWLVGSGLTTLSALKRLYRA